MTAKTARLNFIDRGLESLQEIKNIIGAPLEDSPLRRLQPAIKIICAFSIIFLAGITNRPSVLLLLAGFLFCLALAGRLNLSGLYRRVFVITFFFGFLLSLPGAINLFVEGNVVIRLFSLKGSYDFWIYHIPQEIGFTAQGIERVSLLTMRVFNSVTSVFILLRTTSFEEIMLTLKKFKIPLPFVMILMLSYRYLLVFARVVEDFYLAKKARFLGRLDSTMLENWLSGRIHFLFKKTMVTGEEVTYAMKARGSGLASGRHKGKAVQSCESTSSGFATTYIGLEKVNYSYNGNMPALIDISFTIDKGERIAIIGANGSGKSTLLKIMAGLLYPCSGRVFFKDKEVTEDSLKDPVFLKDFRSAVGYVFQDPDVQLFSANVYEELIYGPLQLGLSKDEAHERAEEIMEILEIKALQDRPPYMLSGGEKKKVAIGSVLTMNPEILLLDEPTSGLDPRTQCFLVELILYLNTEAKKTIVLTTHDLSLVEELGAKVAVLSEEHSIEKVGSYEEILSDEALLLKVNLIHEHLHCHGGVLHRHLHSHSFFHKH